MTGIVLLNLGRGDLHQGFSLVTLQIRDEQLSENVQLTGSLPPAPRLLSLYRRWQALYNLYYKNLLISRRHISGKSLVEDICVDDGDDILIETSDYTNLAIADFSQICNELQRQIDTWLDSEGFRPLERQLRMCLDRARNNQIVLQTEDSQVKKLPWYVWQFFRDYPHTEIALSSLNFSSPVERTDRSGRMRILAVLGDATDIDVEADRKSLETLNNVDICFLAAPTRSEFDRALWEPAGWDMLFFAGHSSTQHDDQTGQIFLNASESLTIEQLENGLRSAIAGGLHLAIFNSCQGLGLAKQLTDLDIPEIIVMREPVPDRVAQIFLKIFLTQFSTGQSLYCSMRQAREQLQGQEGDYPGASWLPVMFHNPAIQPLSWRRHDTTSPDGQKAAVSAPNGETSVAHTQPRQHWTSRAKQGLLVASLIMAGRWVGFWQPLELRALDALMQLRPGETMDQRLLVITIDETDKEYQTNVGMPLQGSLADRALVQLMEKLNPHQPAVIGLDIYRDYPEQQALDPIAKARVNQLRDKTFVDICRIGTGPENPNEIGPPPEISIQNVGFSDLALDADLVVRRQILGMSEGKRCTTDHSFSLRLAQRYLKKPGQVLQSHFRLGAAYFQQVKAHSGGYHRLESGGFEILANYRASKSVAPTVSLKQVLSGSIDSELSELVSGKIVLIGNVARGDKDYHQTPYSKTGEFREEIPGVIIHAHMVSHLVSAAVDERPTLWWWPQWGDTLWVLGWSVLGTSVIYLVRERSGKQRYLVVAGAGFVLIVLTLTCFWVLWIWGGWLPLIPPLLSNVIIFSLSLHNVSLLQPIDD